MRISDWSSDVCSSDLARAGDDVVDLPVITVTQAAALWDGSGSEESTPLLTDAIESLAHDLLTDTHAGWENNDGAYGEFVFDVENRTITLDHNDRYTAVESYSHRSEEHTYELQSLMRISYDVFCLNKKTRNTKK